MEELEPGDCVIHYITSRARGLKKSFIGISSVGKKAEKLSREELIKKLEELGIWNPSYEKFAREWIDKYNEFYFVELTDFFKFGSEVTLNDLKNKLKKEGVDFNPPQTYISEIRRNIAERILDIAAGVALWKVPPSTNCYRGFDATLFESILEENNNNQSIRIPSYLKEAKIAWEWWNFYEGFDDKYYYVYLPTKIKARPKPTKLHTRVIFVLTEDPSKPSGGNDYLVVGIFGCVEILDKGSEKKYGKLLWNTIEEKYRKKINNKLKNTLINDAYFYIIAPKEYSTPLPISIPINTKKDLNVKMPGPGSGFFAYISVDKAIVLLNKIMNYIRSKNSEVENKDLCIDVEEALRRINNVKRILEKYRDGNILECPKIDVNKIELGNLKEGKMEEEAESISEDCSKVLSRFKDKIMIALEQYGQVILYGPPGTGKTFIAKCIAQYGGFKEWDIVTFHQSYSYEDFVEGFRPQASNTNSKASNSSVLQYLVEDGVFKRLSIRAFYDLLRHKRLVNNASSYDDMKEEVKKVLEYLRDHKKDLKINVDKKKDLPKYLLIIDEINRGNISGIFGELITLLEKDKRIGDKNPIVVTLPYSKEPFGIPVNLYIIGTMNTADRSIAFLDWALRRRFGFIEVYVQPDLLENNKVGEISLKDLLEKLNAKLRQHNLNRDQLIGHTYFMGIRKPRDLYVRMYTQIIPLIMEYLYDNEEALRDVLKGFIDDKKLEIDDPCKEEINDYCLEKFMEKLAKNIIEKNLP